MTNEQVLFMANNLTAVDAPDMEPDFNYAVSANLAEAERVAKSIKDALKPSKEVEEFEEEMQNLREKHAMKDEKGNPKIQKIPAGDGNFSQRYDIPGGESKTSAFGKAAEKLREKYKDALDKQKDKVKWLEKENKDFKPVPIPFGDVPAGLSRRAMDALFYVIEKPEKK